MRRRTFLKVAAASAGAAAIPAILRPSSAAAAGAAEALLLSCMDYRLMEAVAFYMDYRGLTHQYDHIILAGASLGAVSDKVPDWNATFWQHLDVAIQLHDIHRVMVLDHRDCGAYKALLGSDFAKDPEAETQIHWEYLSALRVAIAQKYPKLQVELLLMRLDGYVEYLA